MTRKPNDTTGEAEWFFFSGGPGAPRYGDDPTKHSVDHDSEAFVREVLQNANDQGLDNEDPVRVTFRFVTLSGEDKERFLNTLDWGSGLRGRLNAVSRAKHGRRYDDLVDEIDNPDSELRLLIVEDRNTTGLTGTWEEDSNYAALVRDELYSSKQDDTAGGSYGLGKSVLWTFSGASTVVFNSYPMESSGSTQGPRVIARSKFPTHELPDDDTTYQGAGWLCEPVQTEDGVRPMSIRGEKAEQLAERLHVGRPATSGTSAMVVDFQDPTRDERPDIEDLAEEFVEASVKYFWPAIFRDDLEVTVETSEETYEAKTEDVPSIRPFLECFKSRFTENELLDSPGDVAGLNIPLNIPPRADGTETPDGEVRLAARLASPADDDTYLNRVALFRGAGMVVKYYDQSRVAFGDRNFHAILASGEARTDFPPSDPDQEVDRFLRFAEPPEHDEWESTENLREQYQRGFRTALEDMFETMRDGLRHLAAKSNGGTDILSDNVLNRFPIHGNGAPRATGNSAPSEVFEIESSSRFDGERWTFSGRIEPIVENFQGWTAEISLTGIGEDGSRSDEIPVESITVDAENVTKIHENGTARLVAEASTENASFEGHSHATDNEDMLSGKVGETQIEIRAEIQTTEGDES
ncbi:hypothetical protein [Haloarcula amylolytica]|uniref:Uncharacterized protein n=1 Tax=Haloarcula amylolytica JCM 13557 TaxID=1227452 RepID=M0KVR0_9EURY|nr:hypothetical protein [Haloarcula amylolytica]EMA25392.1 hypothetical protein C442_03001 [Haloarcula amylolytica JCM 13557]